VRRSKLCARWQLVACPWMWLSTSMHEAATASPETVALAALAAWPAVCPVSSVRVAGNRGA